MDIPHFPLHQAAVAVCKIQRQGRILIRIDPIASGIDKRFCRHGANHIAGLIHKGLPVDCDHHLLHVGNLDQCIDKGCTDQDLTDRIHIVVCLIKIHIHFPGFQKTMIDPDFIRQCFHMVASHLGTPHFFQKFFRHLSGRSRVLRRITLLYQFCAGGAYIIHLILHGAAGIFRTAGKKEGKKKNTQKRYCFFHIRPPQSAWIRGIRTVKVVPSPSLLYTLMAPRCMRTALLVMARPSPVPPISLEWDLSTR